MALIVRRGSVVKDGQDPHRPSPPAAPQLRPPEAAAAAGAQGGRLACKALRAVCRAWRLAYDAEVRRLCVLGPPSDDGPGDQVPSRGAPPPLPPPRFPALRAFEVRAAAPAALARVLESVALPEDGDGDGDGGGEGDGGCDARPVAGLLRRRQLAELVVRGCPAVRALPACVVQRGAGLVVLRVNDTVLATLPAAGLEGLSSLRVLDLARNELTQLPEALALALPQLEVLLVESNLLTELPPKLPPRLRALDFSQNRLKSLAASQVDRLDRLEQLGAVAAFSHRPRGEGSPVVGALASLVRLRGAALALLCDADVVALVSARLRLGM